MTTASEAGLLSTLAELPALIGEAAAQTGDLLARGRNRLAARLMPAGRLSAEVIEHEQHALHALAWFATYEETLRQLAAYAGRMDEGGRFGEIERLIARIATHEYLNQVVGGIPMNQ